MSGKFINLIDKFDDVGTPIEEHAREVFALRSEFIAYVNSSNRTLEWWQARLDRYSVQQIMAIAREAEEKGLTFEEVEAARNKEFRQEFEKAVKSIVEGV